MQTEKQIKEMEVWSYTTIATIGAAGLVVLAGIATLIYQSIKLEKISPKEVLSLNLKYDKALLKNIQTLRQSNTPNYLNKALWQTNKQLLDENQNMAEYTLLKNHATNRFRQINPLSSPEVCYKLTTPDAVSLGSGLGLDVHVRTQHKNPISFENQLQTEIKINEETLGLPQTIQSANLPAQNHIRFQERTKD